MKYFVVAVNELEQPQREAIERHLADPNLFGFWHWMRDFWLLNTFDDTQSAAQVRDTLTKIAPTANIVVFQVQPRDWAAHANESWFAWLNEQWPRGG